MTKNWLISLLNQFFTQPYILWPKITIKPKRIKWNTIDYHETQLLGTLNFEKHWFKPKIDLIDPHRTKNGQNAPSCTVQCVKALSENSEHIALVFNSALKFFACTHNVTCYLIERDKITKVCALHLSNLNISFLSR